MQCSLCLGGAKRKELECHSWQYRLCSMFPPNNYESVDSTGWRTLKNIPVILPPFPLSLGHWVPGLSPRLLEQSLRSRSSSNPHPTLSQLRGLQLPPPVCLLKHRTGSAVASVRLWINSRRHHSAQTWFCAPHPLILLLLTSLTVRKINRAALAAPFRV